MVVARVDGVPVLLEQVARVRMGAALSRGTAAVDATPGVVLAVQKQPEANTIALTHQIDAALDEVERKYAPPEDIFHVVERYTSCGIGICGKCSVDAGERTCVDGPVLSATLFTPGGAHRDLTGKKVYY